MKDLILAIDLGTSGVKTALFNNKGNLVKQISISYPTDYGTDGKAEQNPEDWWIAVITCFTGLRKQNINLSNISVIGVGGHMMGAIAVDSSGKAIGPAVIHADTRAAEEVEKFASVVGKKEIYRITGHRPGASYSGPKIAWIKKHRPEVYKSASVFLNPKDYINMKLTGIITTDWTDASGTLLYDLRSKTWSSELVKAFGINIDKLPGIAGSTDLIGRVSQSAARETGLPMGVPVVAGAGDGVCAGVGAGSVKPGKTYNYIGTTAWVATSSTEPVNDPEMRVFTFAHAVEGLYHPMGTMQTAGGAVEWVRKTLLDHIADKNEGYAFLDKLVSLSSSGSNGLIFLPYLLGERSPWWNNNCTGGWYGLHINHTLADMSRAVFEGVANNLALIADILDSFCSFNELSLLGGGGLSKHWPQILCDAYGKPLTVLKGAESLTALGSAVIAGIGIGMFKGFEDTGSFVESEQKLMPDTHGAAVMGRSKQIMTETYKQLFEKD